MVVVISWQQPEPGQDAPGLGDAPDRHPSTCLLQIAQAGSPLTAKTHSKPVRNMADLGLMGLAAMAARLSGSASAPVSCSGSSECLQAYWEVARLGGRHGQGCPSAAAPNREECQIAQTHRLHSQYLSTDASAMTQPGSAAIHRAPCTGMSSHTM